MAAGNTHTASNLSNDSTQNVVREVHDKVALLDAQGIEQWLTMERVFDSEVDVGKEVVLGENG